VKAGKGVKLRTHDAALSEAFQKLMAMDPEETQRVMTAMKRIQAEESVQETKNDDIKSRLWAALNAIDKS
jgi:hypothetical protein